MNSYLQEIEDINIETYIIMHVYITEENFPLIIEEYASELLGNIEEIVSSITRLHGVKKSESFCGRVR